MPQLRGAGARSGGGRAGGAAEQVGMGMGWDGGTEGVQCSLSVTAAHGNFCACATNCTRKWARAMWVPCHGQCPFPPYDPSRHARTARCTLRPPPAPLPTPSPSPTLLTIPASPGTCLPCKVRYRHHIIGQVDVR